VLAYCVSFGAIVCWIFSIHNFMAFRVAHWALKDAIAREGKWWVLGALFFTGAVFFV
jgi:hypothetical protein